MPETPIGYFPDVKVNFSPTEEVGGFNTEVEVALSGAEQRRSLGFVDGQRIWRAVTAPPDGDFASSMRVRYEVAQFLKSHRGQLVPFYFFPPDPRLIVDEPLGTVTNKSTAIIPWKDVTITDIRVAGVTKAFTARALAPRPKRYATLWFDKTAGQLVNCGTNAVLRATGDQSITAWVRIGSSATSRTVCSNRTANTSGILFAISNTGFPFFKTEYPSSSSQANADYTLVVDVWEHIAIVKNGANVTFFRNGVQRNTVGGFINNAVATTAFTIGGDLSTSSITFHGCLNDVRYYDIALSAAEITAIYADKAPASASLRGHWRMAEGTGTTTSDASGYANHGTFVNAPLWAAGETEITFTAGVQDGAMTGTLIGRPRVIARNLRDKFGVDFLSNVADVRAMFPIEILELPL